MRNEFAKAVTELASQDERVMLLMGDIGNKLFDEFKAKFPNRFYNCGVAEANMVSVASGLALNGFRPFVYSITPFVTYRCIEQIRVGMCYHNAPVTIVGTGSGLSYAELGPTHHSLEDLAMMRSLPGMSVYAPLDAMELRACIQQSLSVNTPAYIRIGKKGEQCFHASVPSLTKNTVLKMRTTQEAKLLLLSTGVIGSLVEQTQSALQARGISADWVSLPQIKPFPSDEIQTLLRHYNTVATFEEHSRIGGMGSALAECITDAFPTLQTKLIRFGTQDWFLHETGSLEYARQRHLLDLERVIAQITERC